MHWVWVITERREKRKEKREKRKGEERKKKEKLKKEKIKERKDKRQEKAKEAPMVIDYVVELGRCLASLPILTRPLPTHTPLHSPTFIPSHTTDTYLSYIYSHSYLHAFILTHTYISLRYTFPLLHVFRLLLHLTSYPHNPLTIFIFANCRVFRRAFFPDSLVGRGKCW